VELFCYRIRNPRRHTPCSAGARHGTGGGVASRPGYVQRPCRTWFSRSPH
jgi:hypothetical protein